MDKMLGQLVLLMAWLANYTELLAGHGLGRFEVWQPGQPIKLLLVGYNGARNTGADARVVAIADQLRALFGPETVEITVMTLNEQNLAGYFDPSVRLLPFSSVFPAELYRACSTHHAAILCEGSTLKSTFADALTLFFCEAAGVMRSQGKPCIAYGSEVGQMADYLQRLAARLCGDTYFITRTRESQTALEALGLRGHQGTDTAWRYAGAIPAAEAEALLRKAGWDGKKPLLGAAVIDPFCWPVRASLGRWAKALVTGDHRGQYDKWYFFSDSPQRRAAQERYLTELALALDRYAAERDCFPVIFGMEKLDREACLRLRAKLHRPAALFWSGQYPAGVMAGVLRRLSVLVTSRYHAAVLSMAAQVPLVAVSMDERLDGLLRELGLEKDHLFSVREKLLGRRVYAALCRAEQERPALQAALREAQTRYEGKMDEMGVFLKQYLEEQLRAGESAQDALPARA